MIRISFIALAILGGCGGGGSSGGGVATSLNPFSSGHTCAAPALSGSPEQKACFAEAQKQCPEGLTPSQIEFEQATTGPNIGQFLIKSYTCA